VELPAPALTSYPEERSPWRKAAIVSAGIAAIELVVAAQAVDLRGGPRLGLATGRAFEEMRRLVPVMARSEPPPQDLEPVRELVHSGALAHASHGGVHDMSTNM